MKLLYVTNIPAPYRNKRYNMMQEIFPKMGIEFEVLYMAWKEPNRLWKLDLNDFNYSYKVYKGIHPSIGNMFAHFNPGLFFRLMKGDYDMVIVGGMGSPSHWIAPFFISSKKIKVLSVETNLLSVTRKSGFALRFKTFLTKKYDAYQVTGETSKKYIQWLYPPSVDKSFITLPNLIDENIYTVKVNEEKKNKSVLRKEVFNTDENTQLWLCPARLEKIKGLHFLLPLLKGIKNIKLIIVGEGSLKEEFNNLIQKEELPVELVGFKQQNDMIKYYAAADLFILPSLSDPSPLSPIEALAAGLPLLISSRIGNYNDVLEDGKNGWGFNPESDINAIKKLLETISLKQRSELSSMGQLSLNIYSKNFENITRITSFGEQLLDVYNSKKNNN